MMGLKDHSLDIGILMFLTVAWVLFVNSLNILTAQKGILYFFTIILLGAWFYNVLTAGEDKE
jgi:hypothetical protein